MMTARRPEELTFQEAVDLIFPGMFPNMGIRPEDPTVFHMPAENPPPSWIPKNSSNPKSEKLNEAIKDALGAFHVQHDIYKNYRIRVGIVSSIQDGLNYVMYENRVKKEHLEKRYREKLVILTKKAAKALDELAKHTTPRFDDNGKIVPNSAGRSLGDIRHVLPSSDQGMAFPDFDAENEIRRHFYKLVDDIEPAITSTVIKAMSSMADMISDTETRRLKKMDKKSSPWQQGFVQSLGSLWFGLFRVQPPRSLDSHFATFAIAAYVALGGKESNLTRARILTNISRIKGGGVHKPRPGGAGFDESARFVDEWAKLPDNEDKYLEIVGSCNIQQRAIEAMQPTERQVKLKDILDAVRAGSEFGRGELDRAYATGSAEDREFLESLGYHGQVMFR